jgi:hypothetical protein
MSCLVFGRVDESTSPIVLVTEVWGMMPSC